MELEEAYVAALLDDPAALGRLIDLVPIQTMRHPRARVVCAALHEMLEDGEDISLLSLADHLRDTGKDKEIGGALYLAELSDFGELGLMAERHAVKLRRERFNRDRRRLAERAIEASPAEINQAFRDLDENLQADMAAHLAELSEADNAKWKSVVLRRAINSTDQRFEVGLGGSHTAPRWPTGIISSDATRSLLPYMTGVTILSGRASVGKSYIALQSSRQAAMKGFDVLYVSAEMSENVLRKRVDGMGGPPERWHVMHVYEGITLRDVVGVADDIFSDRPFLWVFDSVSSFVDNAAFAAGADDPHRIGPLKTLVMTVMNARRLSQGTIACLLLSESNAAGEVKGRFGDHKADLSINIATDEKDANLKKIRVVKSWETRTGDAGVYRLDHEHGVLREVGD